MKPLLLGCTLVRERDSFALEQFAHSLWRCRQARRHGFPPGANLAVAVQHAVDLGVLFAVSGAEVAANPHSSLRISGRGHRDVFVRGPLTIGDRSDELLDAFSLLGRQAV